MMAPEPTETELNGFLEALFRQYHHDFRDYSPASLKRRLARALNIFECADMAALQGRVLADARAFDHLLQVMTVPVSEMFRDPAYFLALRQEVLPVLQTYPSLKVWVAGCSTGEEVYSLAILFKEEGLFDRTLFYATDINPTSLDIARQGIYGLKEMQGYTANYQRAGGTGAFSDYYSAAYGSVLLDKSLRESIVFADHSLATDSVFSVTHLISCRNVLIYFNRPLQNRALGLFQESLCDLGYLGLGSRESLEFSAYAGRFGVVNKSERIYRKHGYA